MKDPIVISICKNKQTTKKKNHKKTSKTRVKVVAGIIKSLWWSQVRISGQDLFLDTESKSLSAVAWFIYYNKPVKGRGRQRSKMWTLKTKTDFTHISIWLHWIMLQHDVVWWNSASLMAACVYSGCSDHILASRCHSSLVPNVFMLTLSAGIGLQRSYWKWLHSIFKEESIYPFECYLLAKYSLFQFSKKVPLKLNYSRVIGKGFLGELITVIEKGRFHSSTPFTKKSYLPMEAGQWMW